MNSRTLLSLLVTLVVLGALAIAVSFSQRERPVAGELLLPELRAQINSIDRVTVRTGGAKTVASLVRRDAGWILAERHDYAADMGRIRKNLIALAEARILEEKTANPEFYERLGVEDVDGENAGGIELTLSAGEAKTVIIIGRPGAGNTGQVYARRGGESASWLISGALDLPQETGQWLDRRLTEIDAKRLRTVTIRHPDGELLQLEKATAEAADFTVAGVPEGSELSYPTVGNAVGGALADLTLDNVEPAAGFTPGKVQPIVARFEAFDGLVVEVSTWKLPSGDRVAISASTTAGTAQAEAGEINTRLAGWVYTLPEFKGEQLTKRLTDLLQPLPPSK